MKGVHTLAARTSSTPGCLVDMKTDLCIKTGSFGARTARMMMLADLIRLLRAAPVEVMREDFNRRIVEESILGNRTTICCLLTAQHLAALNEGFDRTFDTLTAFQWRLVVQRMKHTTTFLLGQIIAYDILIL